MRGTGVAGVLVGRGVLRNPWIFAQAAALAANQPLPAVSMADRGRFLHDYIDLLLGDTAAEPAGFRHRADSGLRAQGSVPLAASHQPSAANVRSRDRHVINKLRALCAWYTRGFENGSHLRHTINQTESVAALRQVIGEFFGA